MALVVFCKIKGRAIFSGELILGCKFEILAVVIVEPEKIIAKGYINECLSV